MQMMEQQNEVAAGVYAGRITRTLNSGFTALLISIGHRTGLFDVLAVLPPSTSTTIANAAGLSERYVREWLAAMASAHIVSYDPQTSTYFLPIEYAAVLSRSAGTNSLAPAAELLAMLASLEDLIVAGFHGGGGVTPEAYERVNALMGLEKRKLIDDSYLDTLLELVPGMSVRLATGSSVLEIGCGDGALLIELARRYPRSTFRGYDISHEAIARANDRADEASLSNVELWVGDGASLDEPRAYDYILAFESIHEHGFPRLALRSIAQSLRRDGVFVMQEVAASSHLARNVDHPYAPMLYSLSCLQAVPVALAQDGEALGKMWGHERALQLLAEAGFRNIRLEKMTNDALTYFAVAAK